MKKLQLLVVALCCTLMGTAQIVNLTFDDASAITGWAGVANGADPEASIAYDAAGNGTGALSVSATNPDDGIGKAYIFQTTVSGLDFSGSTDYTLTFDAKSASLVGCAVHLQTTLPGSGTVDNFDIQTGGLNDAGWTPYSFSFSGVDNSSDSFTIHFNLASGAFVGAGGGLMVDNIVLTATGGGMGDGCTDATASNYDAAATMDDGSCLYLCADDPADLLVVSNNTSFDDGSGNSFGSPASMGLIAGGNNIFGGHLWNVATTGYTNSEICISIDYTVTGDAADFPKTLEFRIENNGTGNWHHFNTEVPGPGTYTLGGLVSSGTTAGTGFDPEGATPAIVAAIAHFEAAPIGADMTVTFSNLCASNACGTAGCTDNTANNYDAAASVDDGSCLYNVTFNVDMSAETGFTTPALESPNFGWCGGCAPMTDNGDGTWSVTVEITGPLFEYKYAVDDFASQEDLLDDVLAGNGSCAPVTDNSSYANRQVAVAQGLIYNDIYGTCASSGDGCTDSDAVNYDAAAANDDGSCLYNFTFTVDMSAETGFTTPAVESPDFGWCGGCAPMADNGDGTWSTTLQLPAGAFEYKYSVDDFAGQEDLVDDVIAGNGSCAPITDGATYANREATIVANGSVSDIYGTCGVQTSEVTFNVDMSEYSGTEVFGFVNVSGEWNGWCGDCNQMTDNGDGTWSVTLPIPAGDYQYKYSINNWADQEDLVGAGSCVVTQGGNTNRTLTVETGVSQTLDLVCFASCYACQTGETPGCNNANASNYDATATVNDGSCLFDVTFNLNTATAGLDFSTEVAHLFGNFNGWCGGCAPMNDDGDGTWSLTVELQENSYEFKYAADATNTINETLDLILGSCVTENFGFTNRVLQVTDDMVLDLVCWESCGDCVAGEGCTDPTANNYDAAATLDNGSCLYNVIFTVDMANYIAEGGTFTTPEVNGTFNGWCGGCAQMTNTVDDVWTLTIELGAGDYEYQFAVDNWADQEFGLDPAADCTIGANRALTVSGQTDIGLVCWESCSACETPVSVDVTFRVDMSNETVSPDGVHIAGSFQAWDAAASEMTYLGYGIYEITFAGLNGNQSYQYKYINGNTFASEEVIPAECNVSNNREVAIGDMNTVVDLVCFGECQACAGCTDPFSIEYNPFAGSDDGSCATAVVSGCTYADAENYDMAANSDDGSCTFAPAVSDCPEDLDGDLSIGTTDLLQVLAAFGSACP